MIRKDGIGSCRQGAVVVAREPVTEIAEDHDIMIASVLQASTSIAYVYTGRWRIRMPSWARGRHCDRVNCC